MAEDHAIPTRHETPDSVILTIHRTAAYLLLEPSKWAKFLAIMGFILCGLIVAAAIFASSVMSMMAQGGMNNVPRGMTSFISIFYILIGLIYFFPSWYLLKYSQKLKSALVSKSNDQLVTAFENQKSLYKFWGIFAIIMIALYALIFLFTIAFSIFRN